ncbi:MAG: dipeptidase [Acidobacteriaceae bacterium]
MSSDILPLPPDILAIDTHADTFARVLDNGFDFLSDDQNLAVSLPRMQRGGMGAQMFALYVAPGMPPGMTFHRAMLMASAGMEAAARSEGRFVFVRNAKDLEAEWGRGAKCGLLSVEGAHVLEGSLALLHVLDAIGVVSITLTHANGNEWADSSQDRPRWGGLSEGGRKLVREMNRLGMIVDVSHTSDETTAAVLEISSAPVIASHSGCHALCNHPRNLPDSLIREIAARGGIVQIPYYPPFLDQKASDVFSVNWDRLRGQESKDAPPDDPEYMARLYARCMQDVPPVPLDAVCAHIDHVVSLVGTEHVGLGSDWDGADVTVRGLESCDLLGQLAHMLPARGYKQKDVGAILGGNFIRVLREVTGA